MKRKERDDNVVILQNNKKFNKNVLDSLSKKRLDIISSIVYKILTNKTSLL